MSRVRRLGALILLASLAMAGPAAGPDTAAVFHQDLAWSPEAGGYRAPGVVTAMPPDPVLSSSP
jgi:hypothetical protein